MMKSLIVLVILLIFSNICFSQMDVEKAKQSNIDVLSIEIGDTLHNNSFKDAYPLLVEAWLHENRVYKKYSFLLWSDGAFVRGFRDVFITVDKNNKVVAIWRR